VSKFSPRGISNVCRPSAAATADFQARGAQTAMWQTNRIGRGGLARAALIAAILFCSPSISRAQSIVVALVDGVPITEFDITQRTNLERLSTQKQLPRQVVLNTLIDEILEVKEAKRFSIEVPDSQIDNSLGTIASHMGIDTQKLGQILAKSGTSIESLKSRIRAQLAWTALVRGRFEASLQVADTDVEAELKLHQPDQKDDVGYEYTMRPIVFVVAPGSSVAAYEARKREADALRARFENCSDGLAFARALSGVAVRDQLMKFSADLPPQSRAILDGTEVGRLTPPEQTSEGIQMFAVCDKRQTKNDTPAQKKVREEIFQQKFGAQAAAYLRKLRRQAYIEYR
jgi:peptidyl-prolyl cis-trans isomerase SurA